MAPSTLVSAAAVASPIALLTQLLSFAAAIGLAAFLAWFAQCVCF
jgi:hypothetical protein